MEEARHCDVSACRRISRRTMSMEVSSPTRQMLWMRVVWIPARARKAGLADINLEEQQQGDISLAR